VKLAEIVPPPKNPKFSGYANSWSSVENLLGMELPIDFKTLINSYGVGCFSNFLFVLSPFAPLDFEFSLLSEQTKQILVAYEKGRREFPEYSPPFEPYPKSPGLFPWAKTKNGDVLFWHTEGFPNSWRIVICDSKYSEEFETYPLSAEGFLSAWLSGELNPRLFPPLSKVPSFVPVC
jgi:hypothetical protein